MSNVYGKKVTEPRISSRPGQSYTSSATRSGGLERAWTNFGEAKDILERLESRRDREAEEAPRRTRRVVTFTSREDVRPSGGSARLPDERRRGRSELEVEDLERRERDGEYLVDPSPLNSRLDRESTLLDERYKTTSTRFPRGLGSSAASYGAGPTSSSAEDLSRRRETRSVDAERSPTSRYHRSPSSGGVGDTLPRSSSGLPSSSQEGGKHSSSYSYKSKTVAWSDDAGGRGKEAEPVGSTLREAMDEQRRSVSMATDRLNKLRSKPGYYPLSEASANTTPLHSAEPTPRHFHPYPSTSSAATTGAGSLSASRYTRHAYTTEPSGHSYSATRTSEAPPTKRKVAAAPPVGSSYGFHLRESDSDPSRMRFRSDFRSRPASSVAPSLSDERSATGLGTFSTGKHRPLEKSSVYSSYYDPPVRKVNHMSTELAVGGVGGGTTRVTNSASWRIGRSIAADVRRKEAEKLKESDQLDGRLSSDRSPPISLPRSSVARPEIKISPPAANPPPTTEPPGRDIDSGSGTSSSHTPRSTRERGRQPVHDDDGDDDQDGTLTGSSSSSSVLGARADRLSSDMKQLMDELKTPPTRHAGKSGERADVGTGSGSGAGIGMRSERSGIEGAGRGEWSDKGARYDRPWRSNMRDKPAESRAEESGKRPKLRSDHMYPAEQVRRYDQAAVQVYIQRKKEERRRKAQEERAQVSQTAREKEEKLNKLYEEQRVSVERNLRHQQRMKELREGRKPTRSSGGVHIHIRDTSDSESEPALTTHKYLSSSWRSPLPASHAHSPAHHTGSSVDHRRPLTSARDRSPAPTSSIRPKTSPPRYGSFHAATSTTPALSGSGFRSTSYAASPLKTSPYSRDSVFQRGLSPRDRVSSLSVSRSRDETTPTVQGYVRYEFGQSKTSPTYPHSRVSPRTAGGGSAGTSPQDRLQAITVAAQELKERILEQTRRVESHAEAGRDEADLASLRSRVSWRGGGAREGEEAGRDRHSRSNARVLFPGKVPADSTGASFRTSSGDLPGVSRLQDHASRAARARRENNAASVIQAAYRGHKVRKSLHWSMPTGGTLKDSLRGGGHRGGDGRGGVEDEKGVVSDDGTLTPPTDHSSEGGAGKTTPTTTAPLDGSRSHGARVGKELPTTRSPRSEAVLPSVPSQPWRHSGGDAHSVVNIFARQHQHGYFSDSSAGGGVVSQSPVQPVSSSAGLQQQHSPSLASPIVTGTGTVGTSTILDNSHLCVPLASSSGGVKHDSSPAASATVGGDLLEHSRFDLGKYLEPSGNRSFSSVWSVPSKATSSPTSSVLTPPRSTPGSTAHPTSNGKDVKMAESYLSMSSSKGKKEEREEEEEAASSVISSLESSSLVDTYSNGSSLSIPVLMSPLPSASGAAKTEAGSTKAETSVPTAANTTNAASSGDRFSPRSLDLRLQAELNHLDVVTSTIGHVSEMERTRAVTLAQQETVNVARLLQSQEEAHRREVQEAAAKSEQEKMAWDREEEDRRKRLEKINKDVRDEVERMEKMQRKQDEFSTRLTEQDRKFTAALSDNSKRMADMKKELESTPADSGKVSLDVTSEPKVPVGVVRDIAESAASAAAREAVAGALKVVTPLRTSTTQDPHFGLTPVTLAKPKTSPTEATLSYGYDDDFEPVTSTPSKAVTDTSLVGVTISAENSSKERSSSSFRVEETSEVEEELEEEDVESSRSEESESDVTEDSEQTVSAEESTVEEEVEGGGVAEDSRRGVSRSDEVVEVLETSGAATLTVNQDKSEVLLNLIPTEMHRRHHHYLSKTSSAATSDNEDSIFSPAHSVRSESRATTPGLSEVGSTRSPGNAGGGEESFYGFMSRMVKVYMQEEEMRAKHQEALLELREKAVKEKAKVELEWLKLREKEVKSKRGDEEMPPLKKRERGLLRKLEREKAEIQTLKNVQASARQERKMMLMQHDELTRMRQSTQFYRQKISKYRRRAREATPSREDLGGARGELHSGLTSDRESSVGLSESFDDTLGASPMRVSRSSAITEMLETVGKSQSTEKAAPTISVAMSGTVSHLSVPSESLSSRGSSRDDRLSSGKKPVAHTDPHQQKKLADLEKRLARLKSSETTLNASGEALTSTSAIPEVISNETGATLSSTMPSDYRQDTFESPEPTTTSPLTKTDLPPPGGVATSTPVATASGRSRTVGVESGSSVRGQLQLNGMTGNEDITLSEPVSDAFTVTSDGSEIEARIRVLQEQLHQKEVEMKNMANEKARKRKEQLRKREEELKERLMAAERRLSQEKSSMRGGSYVPPAVYSSDEDVLSPTRKASLTPIESAQEENKQRDRQSESSLLDANVMATPRPDPSTASAQAMLLQVERRDQPSASEVPSYSMVFTSESTLNQESVSEELSQRLPRSESVSPISSLSSEPQFQTSSLGNAEEVDVDETLTENRLRKALKPDKVLEEMPEGSDQMDQVERDSLLSSIEEDIPENDLSAELGSDLGEGMDDYAAQLEPQFEEEGDPAIMEGKDDSEQEESFDVQDREREIVENGESFELEDSEKEILENEHSFELQDGERETFENEEGFELEEEKMEMVQEDQDLEVDEEDIPDILVGDEVIVSGKEPGIVRFVGKTHFAVGYWIGVEISEPKGLNDGSIEGRRYFEAPLKCGLFAPPIRVVPMTEEGMKMLLEKKAKEEEAQKAAQTEQAQGKEEGKTESEKEKSEMKEEVGVPEGKDDHKDQEVVQREPEDLNQNENEDLSHKAEANDAEDITENKDITEEIEEEVDDVEDSLEEEYIEEKFGVQKTHLEDETEEGDQVPLVATGAADNDEEGKQERDKKPLEQEPDEELQETIKHPEVVEPELQEEIKHPEVVEPELQEEIKHPEVVEPELQEEIKHPEVVKPELQEDIKYPEVVEPELKQANKTEQDTLKKAALEKKADAVTNQLLSLLLKSELNLAYDLRASRRVSAATEETVEDEAVVEMGEVDTPPDDQHVPSLVDAPLPVSQSSLKEDHPSGAITSVPTMTNLPPPPEVTPETFQYENGLLTEETYDHIGTIDTQFIAETKSKTSSSDTTDPPVSTNAGSPVISPSSSNQNLPSDVLPGASNDIPHRPAAAMTSAPTLLNLPPPPPITAETFPFENGLLPTEMYNRIQVVDAQFVADMQTKAPTRSSSDANDRPISTFAGSPSPPLSPTSSNVSRPLHPFGPRDNSPGSPPGPLSESTVARLVAGEKSPPPTSPPPQSASSPASSKLERTTSVDSFADMLGSIKVTSSQCMVPSKRETVDNIVAYAWDEASRVGFDNVKFLKAKDKHLSPREILKNARSKSGEDECDFDDDEDDLGPTEVECREAYVELVFQLALEMIEALHPKKVETPVWAKESATRVLLVPHLFPNYDRPTVEDVQKRVYASLMRGQAPERLPNLKFLHKNKRPGRKVIDVVDQMLIQELRREEPAWVDYCRDEQDVKAQVADALMESLLLETAMVTRDIMEKKEKARLKEAGVY